MVFNSSTTFLSDDELYDIIVDVVGDDTSREFCALQDYFLRDNDADLALRAHGIDPDRMMDLIDEVEQQAKDH